MEDMTGLMVAHTKENGHKEKCITKESLLEKMEACMKAITFMIRKKAMEFSNGQTKKDMKECERTANNMVKESSM